MPMTESTATTPFDTTEFFDKLLEECAAASPESLEFVMKFAEVLKDFADNPLKYLEPTADGKFKLKLKVTAGDPEVERRTADAIRQLITMICESQGVPVPDMTTREISSEET